MSTFAGYGSTSISQDSGVRPAGWISRSWELRKLGVLGGLLSVSIITLLTTLISQSNNSSTELLAGSALKPRVAEFPDTYYNVFDPDNTSKPHSRWSENELRDNILRIKKLLDAAADYETKEHASELKKEEKMRENIRANITTENEIRKTVRKQLHDFKTLMDKTVAENKAPVDVDMKDIEGEEYREKHDVRDVFRILMTLGKKLDWAALMAEARRSHLLAFDGAVAKHDTVQINRINKEEKKGTEAVSKKLKGLEDHISKNISAITEKNKELRNKLDDLAGVERVDYSNALLAVNQASSSVAKSRQDVIDLSGEVDGTAKSLSTVQDDISHITDSTSEVEQRTKDLEDKITSNHDRIEKELSETEEHIANVRGSLASLVSLLSQVEQALGSETSEHARIKEKEEKELGAMAKSIKEMDPQLQAILSLNADVSSLQGQVGAKLDAAEKKFQAMSEVQDAITEKQTAVSGNIKDALEKMGTLQENDASDNIAAGYKDIMENLAPVKTEMDVVAGLKEEVASLDTNLDSRVKMLKEGMGALSTERDKWEQIIKVEQKKLELELRVEIRDEQKRMETIAKRVAAMRESVDSSLAFRNESQAVLARIKQELADTTQSLLDLDGKYTASIDGISTDLAHLKDLQAKVADPDQMTEATDETDVKTEGVRSSLDDMREELKRATERQTKQAADQVALKKRLLDVKGHLSSAITLAENRLERHPDLFERITCTCYDGYKLEGECIAGSLDDTSVCIPCPEGSFCRRGAAQPCKTTCPDGQELRGACPAGSKADTMTCDECPAGVYCTGGVQQPCRSTCEAGQLLTGQCPPGSVADMTECEACPEGLFCADGQSHSCKATCPDGEELVGECAAGSTEDTTTCSPCPAGSFCMDGHPVLCATTCADGKQLTGECAPGSSADTTSCDECPAEHYCQAGVATQCKTTCEAGLLLHGSCPAGSRKDVVTCRACPAGSFCVDGAESPCKETCDDGWRLEGECPRGSGEDKTECVQCPAGSYCTGGKQDECKKKCLNGLQLTGECPPGSSADTTSCVPCPAGMFCRDGETLPCKTTCPAGQLLEGECAEGSKRDVRRCTWCDRGFFCQEGEAHACRTQCEDGKVLVGSCGKAAEEDTTLCQPCPGDKYCAGGEVKDCKQTCPDGEELVGLCAPGSKEDTSECKPCPAGSYCKDGKRKECVSTCPPGQVLQGECEEGSTEHVTECVTCPAGQYCNAGKAIDCIRRCPDGLEKRGECLGGETEDQVQCVQCPAGFFCAEDMTQKCKETCDPGKELKGSCSQGSVVDTTTCSDCPQGKWCKDGIATACKTTCDDGLQLDGECTTGSTEDTTQCVPCSPGFFCTDGRPHACKSECEAGKAVLGECAAGASRDLECEACPGGSYCTGGAPEPCKETCAEGQVLVGFCAAGSEQDVSTCQQCPAGSWCSGGEAHACKEVCEEGLQLTGSCAAGAGEDTTTCVPCEAGSYCVEGQALPCRSTCTPGLALTGACAAGAKHDAVTCEPCPEGSFCLNGLPSPCKTGCADGSVLVGACGVGSAADTTACEPCPAGHFCAGGQTTPCKSTCADGKQLVGFCAAGSTEDTTTCEPCPAGSYCSEGIATECRSTCPPGELFGGACEEGASEDGTTCGECPENFFCQQGVQLPCKTECPADLDLKGSCPKGSVVDTVSCVMGRTPPPKSISWYSLRTALENTEPPAERTHGESVVRLTAGTSGYLEGSMPFLVPGATWTLHFYVGWPKYQRGDMPFAGFPTENVGQPGTDSIKMTINGEERTVESNRLKQGKMESLMWEVTGNALNFKFEFSSSTTEPLLHPFIAAGELTLNHDASTGPEGAGYTSGSGDLKGKCLNAIDGKTVKPRYAQHDGYTPRALTITSEPEMRIFQGTQLIAKVKVLMGKFRDRKIAAGEYSCIGTALGFNAFYAGECDIGNSERYKDAVFSPWLRPGEARVILTWGPYPRDLDSYMLVPHKEATEEPCEVSWVNKACHSGGVELDYDKMGGFGPETITIQEFREGKYRYRVSEYRGLEDNREVLLKSEAEVTVLAEGTGARFTIDKDGFIKGRNWYVFTIDGTTRRILPCSDDTCGHGYHDAKALGNR